MCLISHILWWTHFLAALVYTWCNVNASTARELKFVQYIPHMVSKDSFK